MSALSPLSKIDEMSPDTVMSSMDLFAPIDTNTSLLDGGYIAIPPVRVTETDSQEFHVPGTSQYVDLLNSYITFTGKVVKADGSNIGAANALTIMPEDGFGDLMWRAVELSLSNVTVEFNKYYSLLSAIKTIFGKSLDAKRGSLTATGWFEDEIRGKNLADFPAGAAGDAALLKRKSFIAGSREFEIIHRPRLALFEQGRFLQPNVSFNLKLHREEAKKALRKVANDDGEYKILVTGCTFWVRKVTAHPGIHAAHVDLLANSRLAKYPMNKTRMAMHVIPPNISSKTITLISDGQIPKVITIALVPHTAQEGSYTEGPHVFLHYRLQYFELLINGQTAGHTRRVATNYELKQYVRAYTTTMSSVGQMFGARSCGVSYENFAEGNTVYIFDMTTGLTGGIDAELIKNGTVTVELKFDVPLPHTVNLVYCGEFDEQLTVDLHGIPSQIGPA